MGVDITAQSSPSTIPEDRANPIKTIMEKFYSSLEMIEGHMKERG
jgi:hypothetical protein